MDATEKINVLLVEDDSAATALIEETLSGIGYRVSCAKDGVTGFDMAQAGNYDILIVDRMLPKRDGLTMVQQLRAAGQNAPVLFLSALGEVEDRVAGLRAGGDDYLVKPYAISELTARLEALARRQAGKNETSLTLADLSVDLVARTVMRAGEPIDMQPREFVLLEYLLRNQGQIVTRRMLLENVWNYQFDPQTNVIDVHISRLRAKIDRDFTSPLLHTIRGAGYMMRAEDG
ncbi:MAG: response regulator transcription factor [Pseudomonadota bacterium]|nr:response regulator transcription factor [Pseudomonadota bacterium]